MKFITKLLLVACVLFAFTYLATADVKIKQKVKNSGFAGLGASESEETKFITADKSKSVSSMRFTGGVVGFFAGKKPRSKTEIIRLDKELMWEIDEEEKEYKETTFAEMRAQMEEMKAKMKSGEVEKSEEEEKGEVKVNVKFDAKNTGEKKDINGFGCDHVILTLTVEEENLKTHEKRDISHFTLDQWLNAEQTKAQAEIDAFYLKMAKAMGLAEGPKDIMSALMTQYGDYLKQLQEKAKDLKGFPILFTVTIETPGEIKQEQKEEEKPKIKLPGGIGGLFGKKKEKQEEEKGVKQEEKSEVKGTPARTTIFSMTTEVIEVNTTALGPTEFELPAGFEKKD